MSDKTIAERLEVKHGRLLAVVEASPHLDRMIGVPDRRADLGTAEVIVLFADTRAALIAKLPELLDLAPASAILWIAYPKLSSSLARDLDREIIRSIAASLGMKVVSQIAIDSDWSAMRLKRA